MTLGGLVVAGLGRNWLRSLFTFAAIVAAFCLFGALQTIDFERYGPTADEDVVIVQPDGSDGLPPTYENTVLSEMNIAPELAARWRETRIGAICDEQTAKDMGWKVHDRITFPLLLGMHTSSGDSSFEVVLLGTYPTGLTLSGLLIRYDYLTALLPQNAKFAFMFVRPARASEARSLARRIDERFASSVVPTLAEPLYEARRASQKNASTVGLVIDGALASPRDPYGSLSLFETAQAGTGTSKFATFGGLKS